MRSSDEIWGGTQESAFLTLKSFFGGCQRISLHSCQCGLPHLGRIISWYNDFSKHCTQLKNYKLGLLCFWIHHLAGVTSSDRLLATGAMLDTCAPLVPSPFSPAAQTPPSMPTTTLQHLPSPPALRPTLAPFPSLPLSPSLHPQPALPSPTSSLGPPGSSHLRTFFCSWLRVLHMGLGVGLGPAGLEDTLPFIRGPTYRMGILFQSEKTLMFSLPEKCAKASLWNLAGGMSLSKRAFHLCKHPKAGPACRVPLLG